MDQFVILNGEVVEKEDVNLTSLFLKESNIVSKKIWYGFGGIPLFSENLDLITEQIEILKLPCPAFLKNKHELFRITKRMLNKNKLYRSGYIQLYLFWINNQFHYFILCRPSKTFEFPYNEKGILVNFSSLKKLSKNEFNRHAFYNESLWKMAEAQIEGLLFQNVIILNENESVCETILGNIYFIQGKNLITPSLKTGCYEDILRSRVLNIANDMELSVKELSKISKSDVLYMDEIFMVGEETGVQWILGVDNRRFIRNYSSKFHQSLNRYLKEKVA